MKDFSYITNSHPAYIESLYLDFLKDANTIDPEMRKFFEGFDYASQGGANITSNQAATSTDLSKEFAVYQLIQAYRKKAHLIANTNPIRPRKDRKANLDASFFNLTDADAATKFQAGKFIGLPNGTLQQIIEKLQNCYTSSLGVEYSAINDLKKVEWLADKIENKFFEPLSLNARKRIMEKLNQGVIFEKFLHTKYIGQKRFSLEGGENTIPALDTIINTASDNGVEEVVIGMAHRGRLNILANILGKTYEQIFNEFEGKSVPDTTMGSGDVKYHMGYSSEVTTPAGKNVHLKLAPNPSHLEAVDPVVLGFARAKADVIYNSDYDKVLPILIHGDASVAGQGIVYEVVQMSKLRGYYTGGTIHFVINNQIGFTTDFDDARTADYCTSLATMIQAPVLHVNGDDAEAVVKAVKIATEYRQEFNEDIFIDMLCYRRHGHNEGDDPKYTQPHLYALIDKHPNPREVYTKFLESHGEPDAQQMVKDMEKKFWGDLQERLDEIKQHPLPYKFQKPEEWWMSLRKATAADFEQSPNTAISEVEFVRLFNGLMSWPETIKPLKKVEKLIQDKINLYNTENKVDWSTGELMAYSSLLVNGNIVRMSGQDVKRGTFSHRHAVIRDEVSDKGHNRLNAFQDNQAKFLIYNSLLSEYGVLGFEYGYAMANPNALVLWEAQFGDFCNGAQTMIDQFISSGEQKWQRMNGVVMLLPHGYEGQGPEHSSARLERFLQMCAELNMVVTNITTAANFFHAIRRQLTWEFRKPMINFSPKANLRHPGSYSHINEFTNGKFQEVISDTLPENATNIRKVLFCSGKISFDLAERKAKESKVEVAIIRVEQLYPLPEKQLLEWYKTFNKAMWFWVQEEPLNMGAASFLKMNLSSINFGIISRNASASTATGYAKIHAQEQAEIIETAFTI